MAVKIRLARHGAKKRPYYRVVVADGRMPRDGRYIELVGRYNPLTNPKVIDINLEKVDEWVAKGAQPTNAVSHLIDVARNGQPVVEKKTKISKKAAAKAAGIEAGESGDMYWAVVSSRGVTEAPVGATPRCISVKRLFGFDVIPSTLYLTGEATETGTDLASAMQFQMTGADGGEFTVIGYLEAGKTYEMCEDTSGSGRRFSIESGELREFGADVKPATAAASVETSGIYRIYVDFNTRATIVEQVTKLAMYQRDNVGGAVELTYQGLGVWLLVKHTTVDGDNRYGFVATLSGDTTYQEKWSSVRPPL